MTVEIVDRFDDLAVLRERWNRLVDVSPTRTVFQTFEWLASWWEAFGDAYALRAVLVHDHDALAAAAPLVVRSARAWGRTLRRLELAGGMPTDYADVLARDDTSLGLAVDALATDAAWDVLDLAHIPEASPTSRALVGRFPGRRGMLLPLDVAPAYVFDDDHDGSEILAKKSLRRHANVLRRAGVVEVRHLTDAESIEPELDRFFTQHIERRAATEAPSHFLDERYRTFYRLLTRALAPRGWLLFTILLLDGRAVAFHYGFVYGRRLVWYKPTFAIEFARLSPGEVLIAELFRYCREHRLAELDFSVGDEPFKERFATVTRRTVRFSAFRSPALQGMASLDRTMRSRAKRFGIARRVQRAVQRVTRRFRQDGHGA